MIYPKPFQREGSPNLYFKYTDHNGKRKQKSCGTPRKGAAQKVIIKFMDNHSRSSFGNKPLSQLLSSWTNGRTNPRYERYKREGKTYGLSRVRDIVYLLNHVKKHRIVRTPAAEVTRGKALDLREWLISVELVDKHRTVNKIMAAMRSIYSEAVYRGELDNNPFAGIGNLKYTQNKKTLLSVEQILSLEKKHFKDEIAYNFTLFTLFTGMRFGEVVALSWDKIDKKVVMVDQAFKSGGAKDIGLPKWDKVRSFPLSKKAQSALPDKGIGLIFTVNGHRVYHKWYSDQLSHALREAKLPRVTTHSFRHLINSRLLLNNISPYLIQKYLGWSSGSSMINKVQDGYTHINSQDLQIVADAIDRIYRDGSGMKRSQSQKT